MTAKSPKPTRLPYSGNVAQFGTAASPTAAATSQSSATASMLSAATLPTRNGGRSSLLGGV